MNRQQRKAKSKAEKKAAWIAAGLCSMCGRRPPTKNGKACEECRAYHRNYRAMLREKGMCKCGRLPVPGGRNCELCRANTRKHNRRIRHQCIEAYGGWRCACCGETAPEFLQIDHINNDGAEHRREIGGGNATFWWLIKNGFPEGFQVLCANCNYAKAHYGICPHKKGSKDASPATKAS